MPSRETPEDPASPYTCADCFAAAASMFKPCPVCGSLRVVLTSIVLAACPEPAPAPEDRSKPPEGMDLRDFDDDIGSWCQTEVCRTDDGAIETAWEIIDAYRAPLQARIAELEAARPSDEETLTAMLRRAGITWRDGAMVNKTGQHSISIEGGYSGFVTELTFDVDGNLVDVGAYE